MRDNVRRRTGLGDFGEKPLRRYELQAALSPGGSASAKFVQWDGSAYSDTTDAFTLYSGPNNVAGQSGARGYCAYFADRQRWEALDVGAPLKIGVLQSQLDYGSSASVKFYAGAPGSEAADGTGTHTCYPWMLKAGTSIAANSQVVLALINGYWYVIQAACAPLA